MDRNKENDKKEKEINSEKNGLILINTGNGKGKTTAALGCAVRSAGHKQKVLILQYIKGTMKTGEIAALECLKPYVEIHQLGAGFIKYRNGKPVITEKYKQNARNSLQYSMEKIKDSHYDLIILDEIINLLNFNLITIEEIIMLLNIRPQNASVILTGSNAPQKLIDLADTVTEMKEIKHAFRSGITAKKGLEY